MLLIARITLETQPEVVTLGCIGLAYIYEIDVSLYYPPPGRQSRASSWSASFCKAI